MHLASKDAEATTTSVGLALAGQGRARPPLLAPYQKSRGRRLLCPTVTTPASVSHGVAMSRRSAAEVQWSSQAPLARSSFDGLPRSAIGPEDLSWRRSGPGGAGGRHNGSSSGGGRKERGQGFGRSSLAIAPAMPWPAYRRL